MPTQGIFYQACAQGDVAVVCQLRGQFTFDTLRRGLLTAAVNVQPRVVTALAKVMCTTVFADIAHHALTNGGDGWFPELVEALGEEADCKFLYGKSRLTSLRQFAEEMYELTDEPMPSHFRAVEPWVQ